MLSVHRIHGILLFLEMFHHVPVKDILNQEIQTGLILQTLRIGVVFQDLQKMKLKLFMNK